MTGYTTREGLADYLEVSTRTISELQRRKLIPCVRLAKKCVRYRIADVDKAMDRLTVASVCGDRK